MRVAYLPELQQLNHACGGRLAHARDRARVRVGSHCDGPISARYGGRDRRLERSIRFEQCKKRPRYMQNKQMKNGGYKTKHTSCQIKVTARLVNMKKETSYML